MKPKLVRNNIPEIIKKDGGEAIFRILSSPDYLVALIEKMHEETNEFAADLSLQEFADMTEVMKAIQAAKGFTDAQVEQARAAKAAKNGDFSDRIFLEDIK